MKRRLQAAYKSVALATLGATVVLMACEPRDLGAATHADWSASVDLSSIADEPANTDAWSRVEQARLARRASARI
ncbi:hypothetical protein [Piscinibacter sp. XHJ-5]|uniref:hypothetical protein n=1 Tax=Piscinibacter sp. XHJ-5 TaxID=3037797 RepID=UPI002453294F|nr:hypothetical protein [Piscinibacter sp. XHJ-5]